MSLLRLFDSHCHFDFAEFDDGRAQLWRQCQAAGIARLLIPGIALADFPRQAQTVAAHAGCYAAYGLHPWWQAQHQQADLAELAQWLVRPECVAVGECGLDLAISGADLAHQLLLLHGQLQLAVELKLPLILHVRQAHQPLLQALAHYRLPRGGVLHAFSGSLELASSYARHGLKLGIGGTITYERAAKTRATVAQVPLDWLVLETDAPAMPLAGFQGQGNSPLQLPLLLAELAQLRQMDEQALAAALWANSCALFALDPALPRNTR